MDPITNQQGERRWKLSVKGTNLLNSARQRFYEAYQAESTIFDYMNQGMTFTGSIAYTFQLIWLTQIMHQNVVMRIENAIKYSVLYILAQHRYGELKSVMKWYILQQFQTVIDFLMHNSGLIDDKGIFFYTSMFTNL